MGLNNIGNVYRIIEDTESAILVYEESLSIYQVLPDYPAVVQVLSNMAAALIHESRFEEAEKVLETAERVAREKGVPFLAGERNRGILLLKKREYARAEGILKKVRENTDPSLLSDVAAVNFALGNLMIENDKIEEGIRYFKDALKADRVSGFHKAIADDLFALGDAYARQGKNDLAFKYFKRSVQVYALIGNREKAQALMNRLAAIAEKTDADMRVVTMLVNRWLDGKAYISPYK
ncbi:tetratricopeptide repeat protein [Thermodesulfobacteriota bacterium]